MRTTHRNKPDFRLQPIVLAVHLALAGAAMADPSTNALPTGGQVVSGQATIQQQGGNMDIQQGTPRAALDWQTFNIGAQAQVNFHQPDANSVALNRVAVGNASVIEGKLTANGQVFLVNPSGVLFGKGAQVDVGGLVATTMNISNKDFAAGNYRFSRDGSVGEVVNQGVIKARDGGYVALVAATVLNEGTLQANGGGTVALAAGDGATLQFNGGNLVNIQVDPATVKTLIENKQLIQAEGGRVLMTAVAASQLQGAVINNSGSVDASSITSDGGVIRLTGADEITNIGTLDASGKTAGGTVEIAAVSGEGTNSSISHSGLVKADASAGKGGKIQFNADTIGLKAGSQTSANSTWGGDGGTVETSGRTVQIDPAAQVSTLASYPYKTGTWYLNANDYTIASSGGNETGVQVGASLASTNRVITTTGSAGDINVNDPIAWNSANNLNLSAHHTVNVNQLVSNSGTGSLMLRADNSGECVAGSGSCGTVKFNDAGHVTLNGGEVTIYYNPTGSNGTADANGHITNAYANPTDFSCNVNACNTLAGGVGSSMVSSGGQGTKLSSQTPVILESVGVTGQMGGALSVGVTGTVGVNGLVGVRESVGVRELVGVRQPIGIQGSGSVSISAYSMNGSTYLMGSLIDTVSMAFIKSGTKVNAFMLVNDVNQLQSMDTNLAGSYAIGKNIDASATSGWNVANGVAAGFAPVGNNSTGNNASRFTGILDGQGHTVNNLTINRPNSDYVGVIGYLGKPDTGSTVNLNVGSTGNLNFGSTGNVNIVGTGNINITGNVNIVSTGNINISGTGNLNVGGTLNIYAGGTLNSSGTFGITGNNVIVNSGIRTLDVSGQGLVISQAGGITTGNFTENLNLSSSSEANTLNFGSQLPTIGQAISVADTSNFGSQLTTIGQAISVVATSSSLTPPLGASVNLSNAVTSSISVAPTLLALPISAGVVTTRGSVSGNLYSGLSITNSVGVDTTTAGQTTNLVLDNAGSTTLTLLLNNVGATSINAQSVGTGTVGNIGLVGGSVTGHNQVGGLVGYNGGSISNAYSSAAVQGADRVGGLAGVSPGSITTAYSTGTVAGTGHDVGGLVGSNSGSIKTAYSTGAVNGNESVGGLVGNATGGSINNAFSSGQATGETKVGGLVGSNNASLSTVYSTGAVSGSNDSTGGLAGVNSSTIDTAYSTGTVEGHDYVGGLIGRNSGNVNKAYSVGAVKGLDSVGGLIGSNESNAAIANAYSTGNVTGVGKVGGLVGTNTDGSITQAYSTGSVSGHDLVGGLVGLNIKGKIDKTYGSGNVNGVDRVGGLVGENRDSVLNSYSIGVIKGDTNTGGLVGLNMGSIRNSYSTGSVDGKDKLGGLAGSNNGLIDQAYASGAVNGRHVLGGLVGSNAGAISNAYSTGAVSGWDQVGGLVGLNVSGGSIYNSYGTGSISGENAVGGFVGSNEGSIDHAYSTGAVNGNRGIGGLTGTNNGIISNAYSTSAVNGSEFTGGLVGRNDQSGQIINSYSTGSVAGSKEVGGLVGANSGVIDYAYSAGKVQGVNGVGGLVGWNDGTISNAYSTSAVNGSELTGGLVGRNDQPGQIINSYSTGPVTGNLFTGGLVGANSGIVNYAYSAGKVQGVNGVGGLVGWNDGTISNAYSTSAVNGTELTGGLVGRNDQPGRIINSYSTGSVAGSKEVGGLAGANSGGINYAYSTSPVNGDSDVGGLVGLNGGSIANSFSTGKVSGTSDVGGLVGRVISSESSVANSYWDAQTSGQTTSASASGGVGLNTAELNGIASYDTGNGGSVSSIDNNEISSGGIAVSNNAVISSGINEIGNSGTAVADTQENLPNPGNGASDSKQVAIGLTRENQDFNAGSISPKASQRYNVNSSGSLDLDGLLAAPQENPVSVKILDGAVNAGEAVAYGNGIVQTTTQTPTE